MIAVHLISSFSFIRSVCYKNDDDAYIPPPYSIVFINFVCTRQSRNKNWNKRKLKWEKLTREMLYHFQFRFQSSAFVFVFFSLRSRDCKLQLNWLLRLKCEFANDISRFLLFFLSAEEEEEGTHDVVDEWNEKINAIASDFLLCMHVHVCFSFPPFVSHSIRDAHTHTHT